MNLKRKKNKQNSLFVSIGGGINQIPLIKEAKNLGLQVIGVDKNLFAAGDGAGLSRDIVNASATGILAARGILKKMS